MRAHEFITEAATRVLFHYTSANSAATILEQGHFNLRNAIGNNAEESYMPPGRPYFLSATRSRTGDYHRNPTKNAVLFTLDGDYINSKYLVKPIDYYERSWLFNPTERSRESEDRIYSKNSSIPVVPMVTNIDVYLGLDRDKDDDRRERFRSDELRRIIESAKNLNIPISYYKTKKGWLIKSPTDRVDQRTVINNLLSSPEEPRYEGGMYAQHIIGWLELIEKNSTAELSKEADKIRYNYIQYGHSGDDVQLRNDLHNAKPGTKEYAYAVKLIDFMVKNRIRSTKQLLEYLKNKWTNITKSERENKA